MKRKYIIEFFVAAVVITVLFIVMFPNFQKAQHTAGVTKSLHDLSEIAKAMETYNRASGGAGHVDEIHSMFIEDVDKNSPPKAWGLQLSDLDRSPIYTHYFRKDIYFPTHLTNGISITSQLDFDYRPPTSMLLLNNYEFKNKYVVETAIWRRFCTKYLYPAQRDLVKMNYTETYPFDAKGDIPYVGVARGPFFAPHIGERTYARPESPSDGTSSNILIHLPQIVSDSHYVEYNPTNGVRSHGYVVYRSPAGPIADVTEYKLARIGFYPPTRVSQPAQNNINSASE
ncbi:hypothetical protein K8I31_20270 [bacterium]|nr:hypothetical protein [bacterium]